MSKITPEQRQRQREGLRRWQASRTPEEKEATRLKSRPAYVKKQQMWRQRGNMLPGRLAASRWGLDDELDDVS